MSMFLIPASWIGDWYLYEKLCADSSSLTKDYDPVHIPSLHPWYISKSKACTMQFDWMQPELGVPIVMHVQGKHKQVTGFCHDENIISLAKS